MRSGNGHLLCFTFISWSFVFTEEPFLAAAIDGASPVRKFIYVTFPLMAPISIGAIIIRLIEASKIMDTVYVLTSGGPGTSTETSSFYIFIKGLREFQMGYAASLSFTLNHHDH